MNKSLFLLYIQKYLIPAIQKIVTNLVEVKKVVIQFDQAGGHGGGRSNMTGMLKELNDEGKKYPKPFHFVAQCSR